MSMRLTELAHQWLREHVQRGDTVVDATIGNGHDTLLLANCVGVTGRVFGFDVQQAAIDNTQRRLQQANALEQTTLLLRTHAEMAAALQTQAVASVRAIVFNLGYLPHSDKRVTTQAASTTRALEQALCLLAADGLLVVLAYPGHDAGAREAHHVAQWMAGATPQWRVATRAAPNNGPIIYALQNAAATKQAAAFTDSR